MCRMNEGALDAHVMVLLSHVFDLPHGDDARDDAPPGAGGSGDRDTADAGAEPPVSLRLTTLLLTND